MTLLFDKPDESDETNKEKDEEKGGWKPVPPIKSSYSQNPEKNLNDQKKSSK